MKLPQIEGLRKLEVFAISAVYFLMQAGEVVYVGRTRNLASRLAEHYRMKDFDDVFYLPTNPKLLNRRERKYIRMLHPKLNRLHEASIKPNKCGKLVKLALQLPAELDAFLARWAREKLTSKSAVIRAILSDWRKSQPVQ